MEVEKFEGSGTTIMKVAKCLLSYDRKKKEDKVTREQIRKNTSTKVATYKPRRKTGRERYV